jgi:hypothetical protein
MASLRRLMRLPFRIRMRRSTMALIVAFVLVWVLYERVRPAPTPKQVYAPVVITPAAPTTTTRPKAVPRATTSPPTTSVVPTTGPTASTVVDTTTSTTAPAGSTTTSPAGSSTTASSAPGATTSTSRGP